MINRLPPWFRQDIPDDKTISLIHLFSELNIHTVCQEARCPNITYCFKNKKFTFIILGDICTRNCSFCNIKKSGTFLHPIEGRSFTQSAGCPQSLAKEPYKISQVVKMLGLKYVVITSVTRDDLSDGGAAQFAKTINLIHKVNEDIKVEVLIPDFQGKISSLKCILGAKPFIVAHNIETVERLYAELRPAANYQLSLGILSKIKALNPQIITKSSIMLGMGETKEEVICTMEDLRKHNCDILTLGQYLAPSVKHYPVKEFINIEQFQEYKDISLRLGFKSILSGPLVRSSYQAEKVSEELLYV